MSNENEIITEKTVIAIAKSGGRLKSVELSKHGGVIEVTKTRSGEENVMKWQDFAVKCGLSIEAHASEELAEQQLSVVGYDSAGTAFSRVTIPGVEDKEIDSMVQLQAESRLPLPADQMELAWRADKGREGQLAITIAAARRQQVQNFIDKVIGFKPVNIYLDCEGIVKAWKEFFSGSEQNTVLINADTRSTQICLVQKGQLINAVALDMGIEDFSEAEDEEGSEHIERFVQDTRSVIDLFGIDKSEKLIVYVLSDGSETYANLVSSLEDAGLNAKITKPDTKKFGAKSKLDIKEIFEYRLQIGLALMLIDANGNELNLFKNLYKPFGEEKGKHWLYSPKIAGAIAAVTLILFLGVCYAIDVTKPGLIKKTEAKTGTKIETLIKRQNIMTTVEAQRIDLLKLINDLTLKQNNSENQNSRGRGGFTGQGRIQLDSFDFKRGKKITITGTASNSETLYEFEVQLTKTPLIKDVSWTPTVNRSSGRTTSIAGNRSTSTRNTSTNTRGGMTSRNQGMASGMSDMGPESVKFTMEFNYGRFTTSTR